IKQWFNYLKRQYPEAETMFLELRKLKNADDIVRMLAS
ncbi:MAG: tRNA dihydrouridine(16) synthase DusC, partial [Glaciecola sp.]